MKLYTLQEYEDALHMAETQRNNALAERDELLATLRKFVGESDAAHRAGHRIVRATLKKYETK
jgi:hypothetical protein